jgi:glyoxylase-like metal-dependent hydrolase (beta-lactamase superfamily II)
LIAHGRAGRLTAKSIRASAAPFLLAVLWAASDPSSYHFIPGAVPLDKGPDGNTVVLDAPRGLIVVDTGRHPVHAQAILDYATQRKRPVAAIINTHWHLDHTTGNWDVRRAFPKVDVYASEALEGALATYLKEGRGQADKMLADPKTTEVQRSEILRGRGVIDHPERIRPNRVIRASGRMVIAGRPLEVRLARFAASEGDVWLYDRRTHVVIAGDLVVGLVPFLDTACAAGWAKALDQIERTPFRTLVPGHGEPMSRADFLAWRHAYKALLSCTGSDAPDARCIAGWDHDAARFIDSAHRQYVDEALGYYIKERLRAPQQQLRYCRPLKAAG